MPKKKINEEMVVSLAQLAMNACNEYMDSMFRDSDYDNYSVDEKLRIIKILKTNLKLDARYQA